MQSRLPTLKTYDPSKNDKKNCLFGKLLEDLDEGYNL